MAAGIVTGILVLAFIIGVVRLALSPETQSSEGCERSIGWHSAYGTHQVYYPDCNKFSQPFSYDVAQDYASMFNGMVVPLGFDHEENPRSPKGRAKAERERLEFERKQELGIA